MSRPEKGAGILPDPLEAEQGEPEMRLLTSLDDFKECVRIQRQVWGEDYVDIVPASLLQASQKVEAIVGGAFSPRTGALLGFVFGLTGLRQGRLTHWSHMVGVLPEQRGRGIGQQLKQAQRGWVLDQGIEEMRWTFDPLIAGNAHFNLNLVGVDVEGYHADMYGDTGSSLHSFGTDRFIAHWRLSGPPPATEEEIAVVSAAGSPVINVTLDGAPLVFAASRDAAPPLLRIEIPKDIFRINRKDPELAHRWRYSTRAAFEACLGAGYRVIGFYRQREAAKCFYVLQRGAGPK